MAKIDSTEVASALREAGASYLGPEAASYLKRRLVLGSPCDPDRGRYNVGALRNLRFGYAERKSLSIGEAMTGDVIDEHRRAYRRGLTSWIPAAAIPSSADERVRLFEERRATVASLPLGGLPGAGPIDLSDDDLLGVGLASYPSLRRAAQELVRAAYRAAPRDWSKVGEAELRALDTYPTLRRVAIPAAAELLAPLGWVPGSGPSEAAEETFRKLTSDWEAFESVVPEVGEEDVAAWRAVREAWKRGTLQPTEMGEALVAEIERARRIRASLVPKAIAEAASTALAALAGAEAKALAEASAPEPTGFRAWLSKLGTREMVVAGGVLAAVAVALFGPAQPRPEGGEEEEAKRLGGRRPLLPLRYKPEPEPEAKPEPEAENHRGTEGPRSEEPEAEAE